MIPKAPGWLCYLVPGIIGGIVNICLDAHFAGLLVALLLTIAMALRMRWRSRASR